MCGDKLVGSGASVCVVDLAGSLDDWWPAAKKRIPRVVVWHVSVENKVAQADGQTKRQMVGGPDVRGWRCGLFGEIAESVAGLATKNAPHARVKRKRFTFTSRCRFIRSSYNQAKANKHLRRTNTSLALSEMKMNAHKYAKRRVEMYVATAVASMRCTLCAALALPQIFTLAVSARRNILIKSVVQQCHTSGIQKCGTVFVIVYLVGLAYSGSDGGAVLLE